MITKQNTLAEVVRDFPQTIPYFNELHLDYCCGGGIPIEEAVKNTDLKADDVVAGVNEFIKQHAAKPASQHDSLERFKKLSVPEMLDDLEATHHVSGRQLMGETEVYLNKILIVHYPHHGEMLTQLHHLFANLKAELEEHFAKEERLVFPLMRENPQPTQETLDYVKSLEDEHTGAGDIIKEIQQLTNNFELPADACPTFKHTYEVMQDLFNDVFVHIFKENSIVFPEYEEQ